MESVQDIVEEPNNLLESSCYSQIADLREITMATDEGNVLELKEMYLVKSMRWSARFGEALVARKLFKKDDMKSLMSESTSENKTRKLLEHMKTRHRKGDLQKLMNALNDAQELQLASMLERELLSELGELHIDPIVDKEAATIVHKEHGQQKRLSEEDRKKLHDLLSTRTQCSRDTWEQFMQDTERRLDQEEKRAKELDIFAEELSAQIQSFLEENDKRAGRQTDEDSRPTKDSLAVSEHLEPVVALERNVNGLLSLSARAILSMENISEEINRSFRVLSVDPKDKSMEEAIELAFNRLRDESEMNQKSSKSNSKESRIMAEDLKVLQKEAQRAKQQRERLKASLSNEINIAEKRTYALEKRVYVMKDRVLDAEDEEIDWKSRCEALERGARLNDIYRKDRRRPDNKQREASDDEKEFEFEPMQYGTVEPEPVEENQDDQEDGEQEGQEEVTNRRNLKKDGGKKSKKPWKPSDKFPKVLY